MTAKNQIYKPELLLPAGNIENLFAAFEGGADALYLGLKKFSARNKAKNFSEIELYNAVNTAHLRNKKIYVALNTLLKNEELFEIIDILNFLSQIKVDAVIIQDFAIINLIKKYFKNLKIHASTQMAVHNSIGCNFMEKQGFERVILSRELTEKELKKITEKTKIQTEIFVHGALCYSFSGQCLFSSYLGGNSANRGRCAQVCRRNFVSENTHSNFFSLKDFQLIDKIPLFSKLKITSLKIEGRMKNSEYVYNTVKAYRLAIDDHSKINEAKEILKYDFAREKTMWFMGKSVANSITSNSGTGIYIGKIQNINNNGFEIFSNETLTENSKLRYRNSEDTETDFLKIKSSSSSNNIYFINCETQNLKNGDDIYLLGNNSISFNNKFLSFKQPNFKLIPQNQKNSIKNTFKISTINNKTKKYFLRISNLNDIKELKISQFEAIFLKLTFSNIEKLKNIKITNEIKFKIFIELPKYISELMLENLRKLLNELYELGFKGFIISHISQIELLPPKSKIISNENVYLMNDISINYINSFRISEYCYPLENDYPNYLKSKDRKGIVPVYFYPELFYSRMPVKTINKIKDEDGKEYSKKIVNGFSVISDINPVSFTQTIEKLSNKGYHKFLIDLSNEENIFNLRNIMESIKKSIKIKDTFDFNIKKGLH